MASTFTTRLRLEKQGTGENDSTWGTLLNTLIDMIDAAIAGRAAVTHDDSASYSLTTANGTSDEARNMILNIAGTLSQARNVVVPTQSKLYVVKNATVGGYDITVKTSGGTGVVVQNGKTAILMCDGTNVVEAINRNRTVARSSNTILGVADKGASLICTSTFSQTLTAAATLGDGWYVDLRNDGTGIITLDPNGSETINGATTLKLYPGETCRVVCDASGFSALFLSTGPVLISTATPSAAATVDFTGLTGFSSYMFELSGVYPSTASDGIAVRFSKDNGANFLATSLGYAYAGTKVTADGGGATTVRGTQDTYIDLVTSLGNTAGNGLSGWLWTNDLASASINKAVNWKTFYQNGLWYTESGGAAYTADQDAINAVRFFNAHTLNGRIKCYGIRG